jgi:hypothetical protein
MGKGHMVYGGFLSLGKLLRKTIEILNGIMKKSSKSYSLQLKK